MWSSVAETFSGPVIELMHGQFDILCGDGFEGHLLWKKLANQSVHILVGAAFPGGLGMGKEEVCIERGSDTLMLGELPTVVRCQGVNAHRKRLQHGDHGL